MVRGNQVPQLHDGTVSTDSKTCSGLKNLAFGNDRSTIVVILISVAHEFGAEVRLRLSERVIDLHVEVSVTRGYKSA